MTFAPGTLFAGRYSIVRELGRGGMGVVLRATDSKLPRDVAIKIPIYHHIPEHKRRFLVEAEAAARLDHPNICRILDLGEADGVPYIVLAFVEGRSLAEAVGRQAVEPVKAARIARSVARALHYAHDRGICHRDLKPANLMIGPRREIVVMDFGLARLEGDERHTRPGQMFGTPHYMAPEQVRGLVGDMGRSCDIYALGVILYELLTGRTPFRGSKWEIPRMILVEEPDPPSTIRPGLDPGLDAIVLRAMSKRIEDRYPSMDAFAEALDGYIKAAGDRPSAEARSSTTGRPSGVESGPRPAPRADRYGLRTRSVLAALGILLTGIVAFLASGRGSPKGPPAPATPDAAPGRSGGEAGGARVISAGPAASPEAGKPAVAVPVGREIRSKFLPGLALVRIEAGEFEMGSPRDEPRTGANEKPRHRVRITRPFYIGRTELTQEQYEAVIGENPVGFRGSPDLPAETISWRQALEYCNRLSLREGLPEYYRMDGPRPTVGGGPGYRLPTEAEWEYAARAGSTTRFHFGDDPAQLDEYGWYHGNAGSRTHPVGRKKPNAWGLFDTAGNVLEWCWDDYNEHFYGESTVDDPACEVVRGDKVARGGIISFPPDYNRSAFRFNLSPNDRRDVLGLRLARSAGP